MPVICALILPVCQEFRKRARDPPHSHRSVKETDEPVQVEEKWIQKVTGNLLPDGWTPGSAKMPQSGFDSVMRTALKPAAALAAIYVFGAFFQMLPGRVGQEWFVDAGSQPTKQPQPFLPPISVHSARLFGVVAVQLSDDQMMLAVSGRAHRPGFGSQVLPASQKTSAPDCLLCPSSSLRKSCPSSA